MSPNPANSDPSRSEISQTNKSNSSLAEVQLAEAQKVVAPQSGVVDVVSQEVALLSLYRMPTDMRDDFYPNLVHRILPFCGNEYQTSDYHAAIQVLNRSLNLHMGEREERVMGLVLTGLAQSNRFGGDVHIERRLGENSAVHECHTAILMNEFFRRAGLFESTFQTDEVTAIRYETTLGTLVHDDGESLGEFNTVASRALDPTQTEDPDIERKIFNSVLRLAYRSVYDERPDLFYHVLQELRDRRVVLQEQAASVGELHSGIYQMLQETNNKYALHSLPESCEGGVRLFLTLFDMSELRGEAALPKNKLFRGYVIKVVEHIQGTRHFIRMAAKGEDYKQLRLFSPHSTSNVTLPRSRVTEDAEFTIPYSLCLPVRVFGGARYNENEVGALFELAETEVEKKLASVLRDGVYQTTIELLNMASPLIDRRGSVPDPVMKELMQEIWDESVSPEVRREKVRILEKLLVQYHDTIRRAYEDQCASVADYHNKATKRLFPIETKERLMSLYHRAVEVGYIPEPEEILLKMEKLPKDMQPLLPFDFFKG